MITVNEMTGASFSEVCKVKLVEPAEAGKNWVGISHKELITKFVDEMANFGWRTTEGTFALSNDKADLIVAYTIDSIQDKALNKVGQPSVVIRHSNNRRRGMWMYVGVTTWNGGVEVGLPFFRVPLAKRHTSGLDLGVVLSSGVMKASSLFQHIPELKKEMKSGDLFLNEQEVEHIELRIGRENVLPWSLIGKFDAILCKSYEATGDAEFTSWELFLAFARVVAGWNVPFRQLDHIIRFKAMLTGDPVIEEQV